MMMTEDSASNADGNGDTTATSSTREQRREERRNKKKPKKLRQITTLIFHPVFVLLFALLVVALGISFFLVLNHPDWNTHSQQHNKVSYEDLKKLNSMLKSTGHMKGPHLVPHAPPLPIFHTVDNSQPLIEDLLYNKKPTIAGIIALLNGYIEKLHQMHKSNTKNNMLDEMDIINGYFHLTEDTLKPLEDAYRGKTIFPIREKEDSIFVSLAAFREHLLGQTLKSAFDQADHPERLYIGAVVQNCFGLDGTVCRTGLVVVGKNAEGKDQVKVSDAPPDKNGIEEFCNDPNYQKYCDNGQIRAIYVHDTDALGPATARYYASKLWGGETYFMQMDSHLEFAKSWDAKYINEVRAAKNYPKASTFEWRRR
jgi:hypothetical protein